MGFNWFKVRTGAEKNIEWKMVNFSIIKLFAYIYLFVHMLAIAG